MNESRFLTEKEITQAMKDIAYDHDCKVIEYEPVIDKETGLLNYPMNFLCPKETELEFIMALEDKLGEYISEPPKRKRILKGWPANV